MKTGLIVASKNRIFCDALVAILKGTWNVGDVDPCSSWSELIDYAKTNQSRVVIAEVYSTQCIESLRGIHESYPDLKILLLTPSDSLIDFAAALKVGATAYLSQEIELENLVRIIPLVAHGELVTTSHMALELDSLLNPNGHQNITELQDILTDREKELLDLVEQGMTNKEISAKLYLSEHTVKVHMSNISRKLNTHNRQRAVVVAKALQNGKSLPCSGKVKPAPKSQTFAASRDSPLAMSWQRGRSISLCPNLAFSRFRTSPCT